MGKFARSWDLAKGSWNVLKADKELLILPVISFIAAAIAAVSIFLPTFLLSSSTVDGEMTVTPGPAGYALVFIGYVVLAYITIFFNAALVHAANERMNGGDPTIGSALRGAASRGLVILPWAILSATVSMVLRAIEERAGFLGKLVVGFVGIAWSLVTFLVLPILVIEGVGVGEAIKKSTAMFKRTWGEQVIANAGIGIVTFLALLVGLPFLALIATGNTVLAGLGIGLFVAWVILVSVVSAALSAIYQTALYHYANTGSSPAAFGAVDLGHAFAPKR